MSRQYSFQREAVIDDLNQIYEFLQGCLEELGFDASSIYDIQLAVSELVTNTLMHGYPQQRGWIEVNLQTQAPWLVVTLRDCASTFDPTQVPDPDLSLPLEKRRLGGYGIYLTCQAAEQVKHQALPGGGNQVTLWFNLPGKQSLDD
jgi:sigma-B regulation protein RsbU (phosphoserine phosphatase)